MLQSLMPMIVVLSWLALPVTLICIVDDWFLRPRRALAPGTQVVRDPPLMTLLYTALPVLIIAAVVRLLVAETLDFSAVLLAITLITGVVWGLDAWLLRPRRLAAARAAGRDPALVSEPGTVDYARSFFPVALVVLLLRSFIFEPFRIPSDSMMPTLLDGDFIIVNKYAYGLRLPVMNRKVVDIGEPKRGDVVVFRYPPNPPLTTSSVWSACPGITSRYATITCISTASRYPGARPAALQRRLLPELHARRTSTWARTSTRRCTVRWRIDRQPVLPGCNRSGVAWLRLRGRGRPRQPDRGDPAFDGVIPPGQLPDDGGQSR